MKIEVCINRLEDLVLLQDLTIDRVEFCIELGCGGLTPSLHTIEKAVELSKIPLHVLVRPRSGNFVYTVETLDILLQDCKTIQNLGVAGIVTGALTPLGTLPVVFLEKLRNSLSQSTLYFHRAFDDVKAPANALEELIRIGFDGLLSSGQQPTALGGIEQLKQWKEAAEGKLVVMPGSVINVNNVSHFQEAGFAWVHLSAKQLFSSPSPSLFSSPQYGVDVPALQEFIDAVKG